MLYVTGNIVVGLLLLKLSKSVTKNQQIIDENTKNQHIIDVAMNEQTIRNVVRISRLSIRQESRKILFPPVFK